jgi:hypothetical protein
MNTVDRLTTDLQETGHASLGVLDGSTVSVIELAEVALNLGVHASRLQVEALADALHVRLGPEALTPTQIRHRNLEEGPL